MRASALQNTPVTEFVTRTAVSAARRVIEQHERIELSERDSLLLLNMLEEPPPPNAKLMARFGAVPLLGAPLSPLLPLMTISKVLESARNP